MHERGRCGDPCAHLGACCAGNWSVEVVPAAKGDRPGLAGEPQVEICNVFRRRRASCRWIFQPVARVLEQACVGQDGCVHDACSRDRLCSIADSVAAGERFRRCVAQGNARLTGCWLVRCIKTLVDWKRKKERVSMNKSHRDPLFTETSEEL